MTSASDHLAACHFARQMGDVVASDLYKTEAIDRAALADVLANEPGATS